MNREKVIVIAILALTLFFIGVLVFRQARVAELALNRDDVIKFFSEKINEIAPEPAVAGGNWSVRRFRFVGKQNVYVEYGDGQTARAFLLDLSGSAGGTPNFRVAGFFEPGPLEYKVITGEDAQKGQPQEIYEYNETAKKWIKVN